MEETKIGARNNRSDQKRIQDAHDLLVENGAVCHQTGKSLTPDEVLTFIGGEVKALEGGKVGGYLVRFSTQNDPDVTGDFFTSDTDFGQAASSPVLYQHGMDRKMRQREIGAGPLRKDEIGIWIDAQLNLRDEYEKAIFEMAKAGKLGWSSGTAGYLVTREPSGKAQRITKWPLGLDASLTPTPAEPRNTAVSLKSLFTEPEVGGDPTAADTNTKSVSEVIEMDELEIKNIVAAALAERDAATKAAELKAAELKAAQDEGYKKAIEEMRGRGFKAPAFNTQPLGFSEEKDAVPGFLHWTKTGQENDALIHPSSDMMAIKGAGDAFNVTTTGSGGALVPDPLLDRIIAKRNPASWVRQAPCAYFTTESDHLLIPREVTSHTAFVLTAESAAYDENEGTVGQVDLALLKYTKMVQASEEFLLGKNSNWETWLMGALGRASAVTENTVATTALLAAATAGTAAAAQAALTIAEMERLAGTLGDGYAIEGETGFLMKRATKYYLRGIALASQQLWNFGGEPVWTTSDMPAMANGLRSTLFGNFQLFAVLERPGMVIQRNPYLHMGTGEVDFFATIFRGYAVLQAEAFYTMAQA